MAALVVAVLWALGTARAETFEMGARASMTPVELNRGDVCRFTLRNGETRTIEYLGGGASVLEIPITEGLVASQTMTVRVDGVAIPFRRYFATQESFYEPAVVNGLLIWPDTTLYYLVDTVPMRYPSKGARRQHPWKDCRLVLQDATLSLCPEKLHPWIDDLRTRSLFLPIGDCYHGGDCWLGPYANGVAHGGLDLKTLRGSLVYAPFACDDQWMPRYAKKGRGMGSLWRGVRRFDDGTLWALSVSHVIDSVVPEHVSVTNGQPVATAAGTLIGGYDHSHFELHLCRDLNAQVPDWDAGYGKESSVRNDCPKGQPEYFNLDPWMLFWQTFVDLRDEYGWLSAKIAPFAPARTGERVVFRSARPLPPGSTATWTFNDGTCASGPEVSHVFAKAGAYCVTLTVTDGGSRAGDRAVVTVSGPDVDVPLLAVGSDDVSFVELRPGDLPAWGERVTGEPYCVQRPEDLVFRNRGGGSSSAVELRGTVKLADGAERRTYAYAGSAETTEVTIRPASNPGPLRTSPFKLSIGDPHGSVSLTPCFWLRHHFDGTKRAYVSSGARAEKGQFVRFSPNLAAGRWRVEETVDAPHQAVASYWVSVKDARGIKRIRLAPFRDRTIGEFDFAAGQGYVQIEAEESVGSVFVSSLKFTPVGSVATDVKPALSPTTVAALKELRQQLAADLEKALAREPKTEAFDPDTWYFVSHALPQYGKETDRLGLFQSLTERIENLPVLPAQIAADGTLVPASPEELPVALDAWCHTINHLFYMYVTWEKPLRARWLPVFVRTLARLRFEGGLPADCDLRTAVLFSRGLQGVGTHLGGTYAASEKRLAEEIRLNAARRTLSDPEGRGRGLHYSEVGVSEPFRRAVREAIVSGQLKAEGPAAAELLQASLDADENAAVEKLRAAVAALRATGMKDRLACAKLIVAIDSALSGTGLIEYY